MKIYTRVMIFRKQNQYTEIQVAYEPTERLAPRLPPGADTARKLKMCINYEDYMKKRNVLHLILLHTITYGLGAALARKTRC